MAASMRILAGAVKNVYRRGLSGGGGVPRRGGIVGLASSGLGVGAGNRRRAAAHSCADGWGAAD